MTCEEDKNTVKREKKRLYDKARYHEVAERKREQALAWYDANREKVLTAHKLNYAANRESILSAQKQYRQDNIEIYHARERVASRKAKVANPELMRARVLASMQKSRAAHPEKHREYSRERYWADPEKARTQGVKDAHKRRARRLGAGGTFTVADIAALYAVQKGCCALCGKPFGTEKPHVDHWVPLALDGTNDASNLRLMHGLCNRKKWAKHPSTLRLPQGEFP